MSELIREKLSLPNGHDKLLLHSCCAPCSGEVMEAIQASGIEYTIFFYNPNIHPQKEYTLRKEENMRFAEQHGIPFIDADYDTDNWFERARGMETSLSAAFAAPCVLICVSSAPRCTPSNMVSVRFPALWVSPAGKT